MKRNAPSDGSDGGEARTLIEAHEPLRGSIGRDNGKARRTPFKRVRRIAIMSNNDVRLDGSRAMDVARTAADVASWARRGPLTIVIAGPLSGGLSIVQRGPMAIEGDLRVIVHGTVHGGVRTTNGDIDVRGGVMGSVATQNGRVSIGGSVARRAVPHAQLPDPLTASSEQRR